MDRLGSLVSVHFAVSTLRPGLATWSPEAESSLCSRLQTQSHWNVSTLTLSRVVFCHRRAKGGRAERHRVGDPAGSTLQERLPTPCFRGSNLTDSPRVSGLSQQIRWPPL